jgi:hypothetical protein
LFFSKYLVWVSGGDDLFALTLLVVLGVVHFGGCPEVVQQQTT